MYAVIKTGGKQYRVQPGDVLVVEKLDGEPGAEVRFDQVLMLGDGDSITVGAPVVDGAAVSATLIETRKGEKVKIFKKIRRQGYRRTRGHRQPESVLRVIGIAGNGSEAKWDGKVDLTTKAELDARARGLAARDFGGTASVGALAPNVEVETVVVDAGAGPVEHAVVVEHAGPVSEEAAPAAKKPRAKKAAKSEEAAPEGGEA
jgi:large subunit ribosomal protein L21